MRSFNKYNKFYSIKMIVKITERMINQFSNHFTKTILGIRKLTLMESTKSSINSSGTNNMSKAMQTLRRQTLTFNKKKIESKCLPLYKKETCTQYLSTTSIWWIHKCNNFSINNKMMIIMHMNNYKVIFMSRIKIFSFTPHLKRQKLQKKSKPKITLKERKIITL